MSASLGMGPPGLSVLLKFLRGFQYALRLRTIQAERMLQTNLEAEDPWQRDSWEDREFLGQLEFQEEVRLVGR